MATRRCVVVYDGPEEFKLEDELSNLMKKYGWEFYGAGTDLFDNERDLSFYKEDDDD